MRRLFPLVLLGGCSFDSGGIAQLADDVVIPDAMSADADPTAPDAGPDATPDVPDAMPDDDDLDDDGVANAADNCPAIANTNQHDEDADTLGDVCDNCPAVANLTQANTTEGPLVLGDLVGDVCDPHTTTADVITMFEPFAGFALPDGWIQDGGSWTVTGDALHQGLTTSGSHILYFNGTSFKDATVVTKMSLDVVVLDPDAGADLHTIGPLARYSASDHTGYICVLSDDATTSTDTILRDGRYDDTFVTTIDFISVNSDMMAGQVFDMVLTTIGDRISCRANTFAATGMEGTYGEGLIALRTNAVAATFPYVMVVEPP